ncbi:MAG: baseplate protein [Lachnospiraceae bacterium]|nr:baseplate protein [Lachnospiraceae bacterium]DAP65723.1 MAG TPA: Baseplate wedge protein [Caudoviricetes sp.]
MEDKAYLGKGIKFPLQINQATGRFVMAEKEESVKESVYIILMTQKEERFTRPDFGSNILSYTFMDTSVTRINMMARELEETILEQEPRISEVDVSVDPQLDKGCLIINIVYTIAESNTQDNLVFPFYLYAQEEGEQDEE